MGAVAAVCLYIVRDGGAVGAVSLYIVSDVGGGGRRVSVLGGSGRVVNSLDVCPASLKSVRCFYFRCVLSSQWKAVTVKLRILHCKL